MQRDADRVAEPQLLEREADREHDGACRDERPAMRRRAQDLTVHVAAIGWGRISL